MVYGSLRIFFSKVLQCFELDCGAPTRTRTADLLITNQLLYQLSYRGTAGDLGQKIYLCKPYLCAFAKRNIAPKDRVMMSRAAGVDP
jgi:hypothetical protein